MRKEFKICAVGCGVMSSAVHGPSMKKYAAQYPGTVLAGCCDLDVEKAQNYANEFGFQNFYTDMDEMLDMERPDAVSLVAPEELTAALAIRIIAKAYPVIMEKPPGINARECQQIIAAAEKYKVPAQVAFNRRYIPHYGLLKERFKQYRPEDIQFIKCNLRRSNKLTDSSPARVKEDFALTVIHAIDAVRFLAGADYQKIDFRYDRIPDAEAWNVHMLGTMKSGLPVYIYVHIDGGYAAENYEFAVRGRSYFLDVCGPAKFKVIEADKELEMAAEASGELYIYGGFYAENELFFNDIREHGALSTGGVPDALQSVEIAECFRATKSVFNARK